MHILTGVSGWLFFLCSNASTPATAAYSDADSIYEGDSHLKVSARVFTDYTPERIITIDDSTRIVYLGTDTFVDYEKQRRPVRCNPVIVKGKDTIAIPFLSERCGFQDIHPDQIAPNKQFIDLYLIDHGWVGGEDTLIWHERSFNFVIDLKTGDILNGNHGQSGGSWTADNKYMLGDEVIFDGGDRQ